jgi:beta-phosphoglucomutase-like phosphatase (HAD superfamily)
MPMAITRDDYDAVLLDLDGVITDTANLHAACWKQMFDEYLQKRAAASSPKYLLHFANAETLPFGRM